VCPLDFGYAVINHKSTIKNRNKISPALNNAGLQVGLKFFGPSIAKPELFSGLFYVAASRLNSPRFYNADYTPALDRPVKLALATSRKLLAFIPDYLLNLRNYCFVKD